MKWAMRAVKDMPKGKQKSRKVRSKYAPILDAFAKSRKSVVRVDMDYPDDMTNGQFEVLVYGLRSQIKGRPIGVRVRNKEIYMVKLDSSRPKNDYSISPVRRWLLKCDNHSKPFFFRSNFGQGDDQCPKCSAHCSILDAAKLLIGVRYQ